MSKITAIGVMGIVGLVIPWSIVQAGRAINERRPADPQGLVEITNVAGSVKVIGWDRPEVEVTGSVGEAVERVDVSTSGSRTSISLVPRSPGGWHSRGEATLIVSVPVKSALSASLVSADLNLTGVQGKVRVQTVSGDVSGEVGGDLDANTVSGTVRLKAAAAASAEVSTISGDIQLQGGAGNVSISTVSGNAKLNLGALSRARFKSVSGDISATLSLSRDAQLEGESVSGTLRLDFPQLPAAEFDVQSFSGSIDSCFGPKPVEPRHGPGSRFEFKNGDSAAWVKINTKSGDVHLCAKDLEHKRAAAVTPASPGANSPRTNSCDAHHATFKLARLSLFPYLL